MRSETLPPGSRFFARVDRFTCECPHCGQILSAHHTTGRVIRTPPAKVRRAGHSAYNPLTSTLRCPYCHRTYQVGLLLWPVGNGPWHKDRRIPVDQKPTRAQMRQIRQLATGFYAERVKQKGEETNYYVTAECQCPLGGWATGCPVHGWDEEKGTFRRPAEEEEGE